MPIPKYIAVADVLDATKADDIARKILALRAGRRGLSEMFTTYGYNLVMEVEPVLAIMRKVLAEKAGSEPVTPAEPVEPKPSMVDDPVIVAAVTAVLEE